MSTSGRSANEPVTVPFAGLRRHARALLVAFGLIAAILWIFPDVTPRTPELPPVQLVHGRILERLPAADPGQPDVRIKVLEGIPDGPKTGDVIDGFLQGPNGLEARPDFDVGDEVVVNISTDPVAGFVAVSDRYRVPILAALLGLFALAVTVVGGWRGFRSLLALTLTFAAILRIVIPLILAGWDPALVAIFTATGVTVATFLITEGIRSQTVAAIAGTAISVALVAVLAVVFDALSRFSPLGGSEDAGYLISLGGTNVDVAGLVLAAVIFGALGVLDDVTVTQASTVQELFEADPGASRRTLAGRAMNVGRSHIAATVNTLVLAYVGASLPLLVLFAAGRQDPLLIASGEVVAVEIVRSLVGSIGIVAAVPVTTAVAVLIVGRRIPGMREAATYRRAPGWD